MNRFIRFCGKIKYLGLLGLPSLFVEYRLFDFLWLFWLFGLVEIFHNFPVFLQSLKQLWGMAVVPLRYGSHIPNENNYRCKVKYSLPFTDSWVVANGSVNKEFSHSWDVPAQRYAYDFLMLDESGKSCAGDARKTAGYYCYGKDVLAPAEGEVIEVVSGCPDSLILGNGQVDCSARDIRGNHILIRHAEGEYSLLAHLQPGSIGVQAGDAVKRGQIIARCGNSGNSSEPHLHFQLQDGTSFLALQGCPSNSRIYHPLPNYYAFDPRPLPSVAGLPERYIVRGQGVANMQDQTAPSIRRIPKEAQYQPE